MALCLCAIFDLAVSWSEPRFVSLSMYAGSESIVGLDEKLMLLPQMLPALEGKSGVLRLENYSDNIGSITFEPDSIEN